MLDHLSPSALEPRAIEFTFNWLGFQSLVDINLSETPKMFDFEFKIEPETSRSISLELNLREKNRVIVLEFSTNQILTPHLDMAIFKFSPDQAM